MHSKTLLLALGAFAFASAEDAPVISNNAAGTTYVATLLDKNTTAVRGSVVGTSGNDGTGVSFQISFSGLPAELAPFIYHIHQKPVPSDGNCTGTLAHLDPYARGEVPLCDAANPQTCQTGDLSGKHGNVTTLSWSQTYVDSYLSTTPGDKSFFGDLSIVIHAFNKTRLNCANFTLSNKAGPTGTASVGLPGPTSSSGSGTSPSSSSTVISPPIQTGDAAALGFSLSAAVVGLAAFFL